MARQTRRRDVNGLFEIGALQRIGLVEERQHRETAVVEQSFQGDLVTGDVFLDQDMARGLAADVGLFQDCADPPERGGELDRIVGADDATAGESVRRRERSAST